MDFSFDKAARNDLIARIATIANQASDFTSVLLASVRIVCDTTGWSVGCAYIAASGNGAPPAATGWYASGSSDVAGLADFKRAVDEQCRRGEGLLARVLAGGTPSWTGDLAESASALAAAARKADARACYAFPVGRHGDTVAVLAFYARDFHEPTWELLPAMEEVGSQLRAVAKRCAERCDLLAELQRNRAIFDHAADALIETDRDGRITEWNRAAAMMFGWPRTEVLGRTVVDTIIPERYREDHRAGLARRVAAGSVEMDGTPRTLAGTDREGREFPIEIALWSIKHADDWRFYAAIRDARDREARRKELEHSAYFDSLTGLPNRTQLLGRLKELLSARTLETAPLAVLFVDLDHFKRINDGIGHDAGDTVLKAVAKRFRKAVREGDMVARIGGDEFVVLCANLESAQDSSRMAERVLASLANPVHVGHSNVSLTASIGIAMATPESTPDELVGAADVAMYRAKRSGRAHFESFNPQMQRASATQIRVENELLQALERNELRLYYQPIVRATDNAIVALEGLMRWAHPSRGLLPPSEFIPVAEESGVIGSLGHWALEEACKCARQWTSQGDDLPLRISVNLSAHQLTHPELVADVDHALTSAGLDPRRIEFGFELTETAALHDWSIATRTLQDLRSLGVRLSIDDFGTGYGTLDYLKRLAVDTIKIDMSFVRQIAVNSVDRAIVGAVSALGHSLGIQVVAEGVETHAQASALKDLKVDSLQGFLYGRAQPMGSLVEIMSMRSQTPGFGGGPARGLPT